MNWRRTKYENRPLNKGPIPILQRGSSCLFSDVSSRLTRLVTGHNEQENTCRFLTMANALKMVLASTNELCCWLRINMSLFKRLLEETLLFSSQSLLFSVYLPSSWPSQLQPLSKQILSVASVEGDEDREIICRVMNFNERKCQIVLEVGEKLIIDWQISSYLWKIKTLFCAKQQANWIIILAWWCKMMRANRLNSAKNFLSSNLHTSKCFCCDLTG